MKFKSRLPGIARESDIGFGPAQIFGIILEECSKENTTDVLHLSMICIKEKKNEFSV